MWSIGKIALALLVQLPQRAEFNLLKIIGNRLIICPGLISDTFLGSIA